MTRFTSTTPLPSATRHACNRALHSAGLPTLGSTRTIEAYLVSTESCGDPAHCERCADIARTVRRVLLPVGLRVPRNTGAHKAA